VHLPGQSALQQRQQAESLACLIARRGQHAHAARDWNSIPRTEQPRETELAAMSPHLRPVRMVLDDGPLRPDYGIDDLMTGTGLTDVAASLPPSRRVPAGLLPTGPGGSRTGRHYATAGLADAAIGYRQAVTGGSGNHMTMVSYDPAVLALAGCQARRLNYLVSLKGPLMSVDSDPGRLLADLVERVPGARGAVLLSAHGLTMAEHGLGTDAADQLTALASGLFSLARKAGVLSSGKDGVRQVVIETGDIMLFAASASVSAILAVIAGRETEAAVLGPEIGRVVKDVQPFLATQPRIRGAITRHQGSAGPC
jgi:predicted regulator of Ras-like GTPase activity (Roadblock/LC7/MglB family)